MNQQFLKNKIAIITGASTGIGGLFLLARTEKKLQKTRDLIRKAGGKAKFFIVDLSKIESINKTIDVLVNAAGIWHDSDEVYAGLLGRLDGPNPSVPRLYSPNARWGKNYKYLRHF